MSMVYFQGSGGPKDESPSSSSKHLLLVGLFATFVAMMLYLVFVSFWKRTKKRSVAAIPGPRRYFIGNYLNLLQLSNKPKLVKSVTEWCLSTQGPIMNLRLGPFEIIFLLSPDYVQKLFGSMRPEHLGKPHMPYGVLKPVEWFEGTFHSTGEKYKSRRKLINGAFGYGSVLRYVPAFNESGRRLVAALEAHFDKSHGDGDDPRRPIESLLLDATLATLLKTIFGADEADDGQGDYKRIEQSIKRFFEIVTTRLLNPWLTIESVFRRSALFKELRETYEWSLEFVSKRMDRQHERESGQASRAEVDVDTSLFKHLRMSGLPPAGVYEELATNIVAGYETTGGSLHYTLFFLALHPDIQDKARQEVDSIFEDETLCDVNGDISKSGVARLEYLEQCVLESLRMLPPALSFTRRLIGPLTLDEKVELPAGTTVGVWLPGIHMNPEYYPNPERFEPDRFSPVERRRRHLYTYMPFSAGPRKCPGYKFAMMEILIATAHLLRHFTFSTTDKFESVTWLWNLNLRPESPMRFVFERREPNLVINNNYSKF